MYNFDNQLVVNNLYRYQHDKLIMNIIKFNRYFYNYTKK